MESSLARPCSLILFRSFFKWNLHSLVLNRLSSRAHTCLLVFKWNPHSLILARSFSLTRPRSLVLARLLILPRPSLNGILALSRQRYPASRHPSDGVSRSSSSSSPSSYSSSSSSRLYPSSPPYRAISHQQRPLPLPPIQQPRPRPRPASLWRMSDDGGDAAAADAFWGGVGALMGDNSNDEEEDDYQRVLPASVVPVSVNE